MKKPACGPSHFLPCQRQEQRRKRKKMPGIPLTHIIFLETLLWHIGVGLLSECHPKAKQIVRQERQKSSSVSCCRLAHGEQGFQTLPWETGQEQLRKNTLKWEPIAQVVMKWNPVGKRLVKTASLRSWGLPLYFPPSVSPWVLSGTGWPSLGYFSQRTQSLF